MSDTVIISPNMIAVIDVFRQLSLSKRTDLSNLLKAQKYLVNETIVSLGDDSKDVFFIVSGKVRVTFYTSCGKEIVFRDMLPGQMFGELSAIDGQERSAHVVAEEESILVVAPPDVFLQILRDYPDVMELILRQLTRMVRGLCDRIVEFSALPVKDRIHAELLRLARHNMTGENTATIHPAPTHQDIANRISTHREAVSREMSDMSKKLLIQRKDGELIINDVSKLEELLSGRTISSEKETA